MNGQWRLFLIALRSFTRIPVPARIVPAPGGVDSAARFLPLIGAVIGAAGGGTYWAASQFWPTSIAVILSMLACVLLTGGGDEQGLSETCNRLGGAPRTERPPGSERTGSFGMLCLVFAVLTKYGALMALSAANLSFALPAYVNLALILIAGQAASRALVVSLIAADTGAAPRSRPASSPGASGGELVFALLCGLLPATLLGTPGLIGLAAAIVTRMALAAYVKHRLGGCAGDCLGAAQQLTELGFYLGALATWTYI